MRLIHPAFPGREVRLAYCLNLHPADTLDAYLDGLRRFTLPLRERLGVTESFGVGMYLPAVLARTLSREGRELTRLRDFLNEHALDPFTYNAFPFGNFASSGLKARVFQPDWFSEERLHYTLDVASVAAKLAPQLGAARHISISTHTGAHRSTVLESQRELARRRAFANWVSTATALVRIERERGTRIVLSLEPEPRALTETTEGLTQVFAAERELRRGQTEAGTAIERHLGVCLDTCHAAVEFEQLDEAALRGLASGGAGIGKVQFTSALAVHDPAGNHFGRHALFALEDDRYLHQVTGQGPDAVARADDLPDLREAWSDPRSAWHACTEWRCHFHVPVDLEQLSGSGLATTREYADDVLIRLVAAPETWRTAELHVEIETYTWSVLPNEARGAGERIDGLEREYRHVLGVLAGLGWGPR